MRILKNYSKIFSKYRLLGLFKVTICTCILLLLLLLCWLNFSFFITFILELSKFLRIVIRGILLIILLNYYHHLLKTEYPNFYKKLGKFIFYLFIITLVVYSSILYFDAILAELSIEFIGRQSKIEDITFPAKSPLDLSDDPVQHLNREFKSQNLFFQYHKNEVFIPKINKTKKLFNDNISEVYNWNTQTNIFAKPGVKISDVLTELNTLAKDISNDTDFLLNKLNIMKDIDAKICSHRGIPNYSNNQYDQWYSDIVKYQNTKWYYYFNEDKTYEIDKELI